MLIPKDDKFLVRSPRRRDTWKPMLQTTGGPRPFTAGSRYRILEPLGEGGAGAVYRVFDSAGEREVALKVLHPPPGGGDENGSRGRATLEEEFRVLASLSHPHLAEVHDYGVTPDGRRYFTMELLRGEDLKTFL